MNNPSANKLMDYVTRYDKRVGLRKIYKEHNIKDEEHRQKIRMVWDAFYDRIPDAYGKEPVDASQDTKSETLNGDSTAQPGQALQEEPQSAENE